MTLYAEVSAINNVGVEGPLSPSSAGTTLVDPNWIPVAGMNGSSVVKWTSVSGKNYQVWSTTNLSLPFAPLSGIMTASQTTSTYTNTPSNPAAYYRVQLIP